MTPDDMEAAERAVTHLESIAAWNEASENIIHQSIAKSIRALLLAYQERGRALRPFAEVADIYSEITSDEAFIDQEDGLTLADCRQARATLKGKSHD